MIYVHLNQWSDKTAPFVFAKDGKPLDRNPFKDARVRKALSMAINRDAIADRVMEKKAVPAGQLLPDICHFNPRCPRALARCREEAPALREIAPGRVSACHLNDLAGQ